MFVSKRECVKFNTIDYQLSFYILYTTYIYMYMYIENKIIIYARCPKISNTKVSDKWHMQTVQTQIRHPLQEQSDQEL